MSFRLVSKSVTLNDRERRNGRYFALFCVISANSGSFRGALRKSSTFAISSPDEFLYKRSPKNSKNYFCHVKGR